MTEAEAPENIDIELEDASIQDVLLLFQDIGNVEIISETDSEATVTMKFTDTPWDEALQAILDASGLVMVEDGDVIRVMEPSAL